MPGVKVDIEVDVTLYYTWCNYRILWGTVTHRIGA